MARPRSFDEDKVLDAAMQTFWRHCYEATTTRMLEDATGVGIRGLFNAFGSKEHLFQKVLQRYCAMISAQLDHVFAKPGVAAIDMVFAAFAQPEPPEALAHAGCLMVNTIQDLGRADAAIRAEVA
ncbi:MAG: helix-turn-helix domain-containing protein, partial [Pseudomonadota bacterium]